MLKAKRVNDYFSSVESIVYGLKDLFQVSPDSPVLTEVVRCLKEELRIYFSLKHNDNYLAEVLELFPQWDKKVRYLENHCRGLVDDIHRIHDMLANAEKDAHRHLSIWLVKFDDYCSKEVSLVMDSYYTDLGVGH